MYRRRNGDEQNTEDEDLCGQHWLASDDSSLDETDIDMLEDALRDKNIYRYFLLLHQIIFANLTPKMTITFID